MKAALWYFTYCAIILGCVVFYRVTTRRQREWLLWHSLTLLFVLAVPAYFFT